MPYMQFVNKDRLVDTFIDLVRIPSPSWKESGVIRYITRILKKLDVPYRLLPCGPTHNLLAKLEGDRSVKPILFSCHMDTVIPCDRINPVIEGNRISSDGESILGGDDKAAIAAILETLRILKEKKLPHGPLEFLFSSAEEIGLKGIKEFDFSLLKSRYAFVFDSGGDIGTVVINAPTQITMEIKIRGRAAHAGMEPEKGISAIRVLAEIIASIPHGRIDESTTVNVGVMSGGKATNIVAEEAMCRLEIRSLYRERLKSVETSLKKICREKEKSSKAKISVTRNLEYESFTIDPHSNIAVIAAKAVRGISKTPRFTTSGGGSDTNIINRSGIKAVNMSIGMRNVHTKNEYIQISDLIDGTRLMLSLIETVR